MLTAWLDNSGNLVSKVNIGVQSPGNRDAVPVRNKVPDRRLNRGSRWANSQLKVRRRGDVASANNVAKLGVKHVVQMILMRHQTGS
jgi:hypothetical protein